MANLQLAIPGQKLGSVSEHVPGLGTYVERGHVYASTVGRIHQMPPSSSSTSRTSHHPEPTISLPTISVIRPGLEDSPSSSSSSSSSSTNILPPVGGIILARVTRINPRQANVTILVIGDHVCADEFPGIIRVQDVRATEKDKVKIFTSFRPGDIVRAQVISLGDQTNYYLSTARNELGVIMATSEVGNTMLPISWKEFRDPLTGLVEPRKVAKPF